MLIQHFSIATSDQDDITTGQQLESVNKNDIIATIVPALGGEFIWQAVLSNNQ